MSVSEGPVRMDRHLLSISSLQCYYLGGTDDAATGILSEMSKPMSWGMPPEKVCEKLKKRDVQVCELRYGRSGSAWKETPVH